MTVSSKQTETILEERCGEQSLSETLTLLFSSSEEARKAYLRQIRVNQIHERWKRAVNEVFQEAAHLVQEHVNGVFILPAGQVRKVRILTHAGEEDPVLVVYCDDSQVRSEIDARQEQLKASFWKQGEQVFSVAIPVANGDMRNRHPFCSAERTRQIQERLRAEQVQQTRVFAGKAHELSQQQKEFIETCCSCLEDTQLKRSVVGAMQACLTAPTQ